MEGPHVHYMFQRSISNFGNYFHDDPHQILEICSILIPIKCWKFV